MPCRTSHLDGDSRVEWCACFVCWCADQCGYIETDVCPKYAGCINGVAWFKERNQWVDGSETLSPGTIIFYDWDSPDGESGPQDGLSDHTGIVEKVENGIVYTVEGNSGDACRQRKRAVGNYEILGYGVLIPWHNNMLRHQAQRWVWCWSFFLLPAEWTLQMTWRCDITPPFTK